MAQTGLLDINPGLIFWTLVTFIVLLIVLKKYVWGPVLDAVDRREIRLREMFESAEKSRNEAERLLKEHEAHLAGARDEVNRILEDGKARAGRSADEIIGKARAEAQQFIERAKAEISQEREKAVDEIKQQVVRISLSAAEQLIEKSLSETEHRGFIEKAISDIDARVK